MTPQENQSLQQLLSQLVQVKDVAKDAEAERMIAQAASQQPDAVYLLVQRAMLLEQAVNAAQERIAALEAQQRSAQSSSGGSFLDANAWGKTPTVAARAQPSQELSATGKPLRESSGRSSFTTQAAPAVSPYPPAGGPSSFLRGGGGSMLGTLAATAAGVAGGAFLYQGIGNLLGGHQQHLSDNVSGNKDKAEVPTENASGLADKSAETASDSPAPVFDDPGGLDIPTDEQLASAANLDTANFDSDVGSDTDSYET